MRILVPFLFVPALLLFSTLVLAGEPLPVDGVVTSGVGWRPDPFGSGKLVFHRGVDIAVPVGTPVRATRPGKVVFAGVRPGYGIAVIVRHENGDRTLYGHNSALEVRTGAWVAAGAVVALSGNSGRSTGPHVHYEVMAGGKTVLPDRGAEEEPGAVAADATGAGKPEQGGRRSELERRMELTVDSLFKTIRSEATGG